MMPALFFPAVAAIGGELPLRHYDVSIIALAVVSTGVLIVGVLTTWSIMRRKPPIEREIDDRIAGAIAKLDSDWKYNIGNLREEVLQIKREQRDTIEGIFKQLERYRTEANDSTRSLQQSVEQGFKDLHRAIGRLEGGPR